MNNLAEEFGLEPEVVARLSQRAIHYLHTYGMTAPLRRLVWVQRFKLGIVDPPWRSNSEREQDTFDADYAEFEQQQWEDAPYD